jgi:hypothetical protein
VTSIPILLVDDNEPWRRMVPTLLQLQGVLLSEPSDVMVRVTQDLPRLRRNEAINGQALDAIHESGIRLHDAPLQENPEITFADPIRTIPRPLPCSTVWLTKVLDISVLFLQSRFHDGDSELLALVIANDHSFAL